MTGHTYEILLALGILAPFISFWLLVFFGAKLGKPGSGWFAVVLGMGVPLVLATIVLIGWWSEDPGTRATLSDRNHVLHGHGGGVLDLRIQHRVHVRTQR